MAAVVDEARTGTIRYYPGCSLSSSAREMEESFEDVARELSLAMAPMEDWSCCGSSPAHSTHPTWALLLAARNLILAEGQGGGELMVMCPSCFVRLREADRQIREDQKKAREVERVFGTAYKGGVRLRFFLEVLGEVGLEVVRSRVKRPMEGLKGALYYGCLLSRPEWITGFDVGPYETFLEELFRALGAEPVRWGYARQCCGAHLAVSKPRAADGLVDRIRGHARKGGANCLVVFCPLCQVNLELRGTEVEPLPVLYISEVMGLAFRSPHARGWLSRHLVDPVPLLSSLKLL